MSTTKKTKEQELEREQRVLEQARAGHTMAEILDMEGLDKNNAARWHRLLRQHGLQANTARASAPPIGLTPETISWRYRIGRHLERLREQHPQITVSRMVGMTNTEINAATVSRPTHDWTVSQLYRLSIAVGVPFETMMVDAFKGSTPSVGFRRT